MSRAPILTGCAVLALTFWQSTPAQVTPGDSTVAYVFARVEILSDVDSALVYFDTTFVGRTPFVDDSVRAGIYILRVLHPRAESWLGGTVRDTLLVNPGEPQTLRYSIRPTVALTSQPSGAAVYLGDSLAGETPLLLSTLLLRPDVPITLRKDGFEPVDVRTLELTGSVFQTALKAGWQKPPAEDSPFLSGQNTWNTRRVGLYVSGGVSVLAGIAAAYFKIAADDREAAYRETGNPVLLNERRHLDTWAGISLALTQVGLATFSYLLISE